MITFKMLLSLLCGLAIFIFGMRQMTASLKELAQKKLKHAISSLITSPYKGALIGCIFTALIQSSSAVTVLVVSMVDASAMSLLQAAGVIMGANLGTTVTTQLISLNLTTLIPYFIFLGSFFMIFSRRKKYETIGHFFFSFGILFLGLSIVKTTVYPIVQTEMFQDLIISLQGKTILCLLLGIAITFFIQSSSASTAILISLASTGAISLYTAVPILFGHEIGTCMTAILSSLSGKLAAKQAAFIHFAFNVVGMFIFLPLIGFLIQLTHYFSQDPGRQIANIQLIFNLSTVILFLPFSNLFVKLALLVFPTPKTR
ncbi:MAG TPA: Na/Pi cotransporter [Firmicutes bacterium]|nr:Na/Pi cotransporter [Bacillota bacterium]